jgi:phosphoglycolate phosphatase-like HAD superfamily hydrolase
MTDKGRAVYGKIDRTRIEAVLFDVDGTLSDTDDQVVARLVKFLGPISWLFSDRDPGRFARWVVMALETPGNFFYMLADRIGLDSHISKVILGLSRRRQSRKGGREKFWMIPGIREVLARLVLDYPLAVVSARDAESTRAFLEYFELSSFFKVVVTSQTTPYTKPSPQPIIYAAEALGVPPEHCLMVGDTVVDIRSGNSAGAQTVGVLCGFGTAKELKRVGADMLLLTTSEIEDYLIDR